MRQEPPNIDYILIGNGRLAKHLLRYFKLLGLKVAQWSRASTETEAYITLNKLDDLRELPQIPILVAVSDDSIRDVVILIRKFSDNLIVHFSGALCSTEINLNCYSMHPLFTFNYDMLTLDQYTKIPFICEPSGPAFAEVFPKLSNPTSKISNDHRRLYHSVACLASNLPAMIWKECAQIAQGDLTIDWAIYEPLVIQTLKNSFQNPQSSVTGPIIRKDWNLVSSQLEVLPDGLAAKLYSAAATENKEKS